jgi:hypothetical protein
MNRSTLTSILACAVACGAALSQASAQPRQSHAPMRLAQASDCIISYVDCRTKETQTISMKPGDTAHYGDWENEQCVRKTYQCPSNKGG